jgi:hypothetical protein
MKKIKFYICFNVPFDPYSGGIIALHKLVHNLCTLGEEAYLTTSSKNPNWLGNIYNGEQIDFENSIGIYPEIIGDNPMNFKYAVRWLLYDRGYTYPKSDWIYNYWDYFKAHKENEDQVKGLLSAFDIQRDVFYDKGIRINGKYCHVIRKGANKILDKHPHNSILIDDYYSRGGNEYLSKIFNECQYLVSYDDATFLTSQAILCGCIPIIIPNDGVSRDLWTNSIDLHKYGHAYGFDDIEHAINTRHLFLETIEKQEQQSLDQTQKFIKDCYKRIYGD